MIHTKRKSCKTILDFLKQSSVEVIQCCNGCTWQAANLSKPSIGDVTVSTKCTWGIILLFIRLERHSVQLTPLPRSLISQSKSTAGAELTQFKCSWVATNNTSCFSFVAPSFELRRSSVSLPQARRYFRLRLR